MPEYTIHSSIPTSKPNREGNKHPKPGQLTEGERTKKQQLQAALKPQREKPGTKHPA
jgi:hypothetical protein